MKKSNLGGTMFILHTDKDGDRSVGSIVDETDAKYQVWFGGTINRKPRVFWVDKTECKKISPNKIFVCHLH